MWTIFKVFIEFVTILLLIFVLVFWPQDMWDLSSPTRDWTCTPCIGRRSLNHWTARDVPKYYLNKRLCIHSFVFIIDCFIKVCKYLEFLRIFKEYDYLTHNDKWPSRKVEPIYLSTFAVWYSSFLHIFTNNNPLLCLQCTRLYLLLLNW